MLNAYSPSKAPHFFFFVPCCPACLTNLLSLDTFRAYHWMINQIECLGLKWDRVPMKESKEESWKQLGFLQARCGC